MKAKNWTTEEIKSLKYLYIKAPFQEILDTFPYRSQNSIRLMASRLGLRRPDLIIDQFQENQEVNEIKNEIRRRIKIT